MAGRIPQQFIDDLMNRVDIVDVIGGRIQLKKTGREYSACCPFHNEKTPSFTVSPAKQFYHCFGCGVHGTAIGFLMDYENLDFIEAVEELARGVGVEVPREAFRDDHQRQQSDNLYRQQMEAARWFQRMLREHPRAQTAVDYLKQRGLTGEIARDFGLGYAPPGWDNLTTTLGRDETGRRDLVTGGLAIRRDNGEVYDRFRDRIMFPIHDRRGRVVAFGGRVLGDDTPKYLNSPETPIFHKGRELYGLFEARKAVRKLEMLLVVEGYMDVVALAQFGIRNAVATLGTATTTEHLEQLFRVVPEVVFCFDGDRAGLAAAWRALENSLPVLREGREARFLFLPEGDDPDTLVRREGADGLQARIANAIPFSRFFFEHLAADVDMQSIDGRARLVERAGPYLEKLQPGVFRRMMVQQLERLAQLPGGELQALAGEGGRAPARPGAGDRRRARGNTPVRHTIALLVQHPQLAEQVGDTTRLRCVTEPGVEVLADLIEFVHSRPHIRTSGILEHWRDTEVGRHLGRLAMAPLEIPETGLETEFAAYLAHIEGMAEHSRSESRLEHLSSRRPSELSDDEKQELKELIGRYGRPRE